MIHSEINNKIKPLYSI